MDAAQLKQKFMDVYEGDAAGLRVFYAPGRVNLIGEHIDYNGGYVFPCALNFGTYGVARKRNDNTIRLVSGNIDAPVQVELDTIKYDPAHDWANYPKGVVAEFIKLKHQIGGFDLYIWGNIPNGAGLSSSASIEMLTAVVINGLFNLDVPVKEMVLLCQRAENKFVGVNCGIMDQYAVGFGKKQHALLIDCLNIEHKYVPFALGQYKVVITNTNKKHALGDSKYNERRAECDEALRILRHECGEISCLCDLSPEVFNRHSHMIKDKVVRNRAAHAVYENARVSDAVNALTAGDLIRFGKLMNESHISLKDLYEVTCTELDVLAKAAWQAKGVLGSRMTGAGFGGCTVSIVDGDAADDFIQSVGAEYTHKTGITADFYVAETGDGAKEIL